MNDTAEITALIHEYAAAVDRAEFEALGRLFAKGVLHSPRGEARGDEVTEWYRSVKLDEHGSPGTWHHVFGVDIEVEGDRATAHSYITVIQHHRPIIAATYDDSFVRDGGAWRFDIHRVSMDLIGDLRGHLDLR